MPTQRRRRACRPEKVAAGLRPDHWARSESIIPLTAVCDHWHEHVHMAVPYRWADSGADGVKLETFMDCGRRYTTIEAVRRFRDRRNRTLEAKTRDPRHMTGRTATASAERVGRRLDNLEQRRTSRPLRGEGVTS